MLPKTVAFGVDGVSYRFLLELVNEGQMPHLAEALEQGHIAPLTSTIPPITPAAFSASYTGKSPDRNNVYGFFRQRPGTYELTLASASDRRKPDVWDILHHWGKRALVIGMPFTYPVQVAEDFSGVIVTGFSTSENIIDVYPPELRSMVLEEYGYTILTDGTCRPGTFVDSITNRFQVTARLLERDPYDCLMLGFAQTDMAHHRFLARDRAIVLDLYRHFDRELGDFIKRFPPETLFLLYSDHGHKVYKKAFNVVAWLVQNDYLSLHIAPEVQAQGYTRIANILARAVTVQLRRLYVYLNRHDLVRYVKWILHPSIIPGTFRFINISPRESFDFGSSKVYPLTTVANFVFLLANRIGRDPLGTVSDTQVKTLGDQLRSELLALRDPSTGAAIIKNVWQADELFPEEQAEHFCDFIVEANEDYTVVDCCYSPEEIGMPLLEYPIAQHEMTGVVAYWGGKSADLETVDSMDLVDICPTILHAMGLPIPNDLDGRPAMLTQEMSARHVETFDPTAEMEFGPASSGSVYTQEEEEQIKARLRDLGYL